MYKIFRVNIENQKPRVVFCFRRRILRHQLNSRMWRLIIFSIACLLLFACKFTMICLIHKTNCQYICLMR